MRVLVTGATGNVGTRTTAALAADPGVDTVIALARRAPEASPEGVEFHAADITRDPLGPILRDIDVVVHLAWLIQPARDESITSRVNVEGSRRVFEAAARTGTAIVHASSVGTYAAAPRGQRYPESWPATGIPSSFYARHKAACEALLDALEREHPTLRVVRLRPGLIFQRSAATEIRRLFLGPFVPGSLARPGLIPIVPDPSQLQLQAVHADDVADAYRRAVLSDARGAFNVAAEPVLDGPAIASVLDARPVRMPGGLLRAAAAAAYRLRLTPTEPGWVDLALSVPLMSTERARNELGWSPVHSATDAFRELLDGMREGADGSTPPLRRSTGGRLRWRELVTGVGRRP